MESKCGIWRQKENKGDRDIEMEQKQTYTKLTLPHPTPCLAWIAI